MNFEESTKVKWYTASKFSHPYDFEDPNIQDFLKENNIQPKTFKYTSQDEIIVITKGGEVITNVYYSDGDIYDYFDGKIDLTSQDWNTQHVVDGECCNVAAWIEIDKWCYMEDVVNKALNDLKESKNEK